MQPLIENRLVEEVGVDFSKPKVIGVGIVGVILAGLFGYFLSSIILQIAEILQNTNQILLDNWQSILLTTLFAVGFSIIFLLQVFFIKSQQILRSLLILESLAITIPLIGRFSGWLLFAWIALLTFFLIASNRGRNQLENQLRIKFFQVERYVIPGVLTAISLFIGLVSVSLFSFQGAIISKKGFEVLIQPAAPLVSRYVDNFSFSMTVSQLAESIALKQLGDKAKLLSKSERTFLVNQVINQLRPQLVGYGITDFKSSDAITDLLYDYLVKQINKIPGTLKNLVPLLFALLLFLIVKGFAIFLRWIIALPAYILFHFAMLLGFAKLSLESKSREIIILK